jgi:formylglycine-generating enzyme required for sulfatase activity
VNKIFLMIMGCALLLAGCGTQVETRINPTDGKAMVRVPAGEFTMGISDAQIQLLVDKHGASVNGFEFEKPEHKVTLGEFWIDRDPVTNAEYKKFLDANPARPVPDIELAQLKGWSWDPAGRSFPPGRENFPAVLVTWQDASEYCKWAGMRLPTEAEWEKAARGTDGRMYPWGTEWSGSKTAYGERGTTDSAPIGSFPAGASPYGANDMVGNVWQWTGTLYKEYPYRADDGREEQATAGDRATRGGMFAFGAAVSRANVRNRLDPTNKAISVGFRCAM